MVSGIWTRSLRILTRSLWKSTRRLRVLNPTSSLQSGKFTCYCTGRWPSDVSSQDGCPSGPFFLCLSASEQDYPVVKTVSIFLNKLYIIHLNFSSWTPLNSIAIYSSGRVSREAAEYAGSWGISSCQESLSGPKTVVSNRARPNLTGRYSIWRGISGELLIILMYEVYSIGTGYYMARQRPRGSIILSARYGAWRNQSKSWSRKVTMFFETLYTRTAPA